MNDVNNDIKMLSDSMADINSPLIPTGKVFRLAMLWPGLCISGYAIAVGLMVANFKAPSNQLYDVPDPLLHYLCTNLVAGALCALFAIFLGVGLYGPALMYLTIPEKVRNKSIIITMLRKKITRIGCFFLFCNLALAMVACFYRDVIYCAPVLMMMSFFIMQWIVSAELMRYGIAPFMKKMVAMSRKF
jgi:hypothetical protein